MVPAEIMTPPHMLKCHIRHTHSMVIGKWDESCTCYYVSIVENTNPCGCSGTFLGSVWGMIWGGQPYLLRRSLDPQGIILATTLKILIILPSGNLTQLLKVAHLQLIYPLIMVIFHICVNVYQRVANGMHIQVIYIDPASRCYS